LHARRCGGRSRRGPARVMRDSDVEVRVTILWGIGTLSAPST
jgi:hypothetical protein